MNAREHLPTFALTRRQWLRRCGLGFGALAFAGLCAEADETGVRSPHFAPRARRVVHLFLEGGLSHLDTFDPKPALTQRNGQPIPRPGDDGDGTAMGSPFRFTRHGHSGLAISEVFPHLARCADELCVIRSLQTDEPSHEQAMLMLNCGDGRLSRPSVGSWVTYGLGSVNRNLPGFVVLFHENQPLQGAQNWQAAFLPDQYQGVAVDTRNRRVEELIEHIASPHASSAEQRLQLDLLGQLNRQHAEPRTADARLEARVESFELAYRMQTEAAEAFDLNREPRQVRELYGATPQGRQFLIARRLLERGVRFVQLYVGNWDHHDNLAEELRNQAQACDRPMAALIIDLKRRGMLDDTLVVCAGEFGRTPTADLNPAVMAGRPGRDHNHRGFSGWLAGGGVKRGVAYGATDEFGFAAVEDPVHVHDLHATVLHLFGFDHERLTYRYAGRDFRLTDVRGRVVEGLLA
jgi:hypothetical protein